MYAIILLNGSVSNTVIISLHNTYNIKDLIPLSYTIGVTPIMHHVMILQYGVQEGHPLWGLNEDHYVHQM